MAQQGGAHAAGRAEGLGTSGVDVDAGHVGGDDGGGLDRPLRRGRAQLEDESAAFPDGVEPEDDALALGLGLGLGSTLGWTAGEVDGGGLTVDASAGAYHGPIDRLGAPDQIGSVLQGQQSCRELSRTHHGRQDDLLAEVDPVRGDGPALVDGGRRHRHRGHACGITDRSTTPNG